LKVGNSAIFKGYLLPIYNGELANEHGFSIRTQYLQLIGAGLLIFV